MAMTGRRVAIIVAICFLTAHVPSVQTLIAVRFVAGIALGGATAVALVWLPSRRSEPAAVSANRPQTI